MSVQDSESRRFELTFGLSFSQADLGPKICSGMFFFGVFERFETFCSEICAHHGERYRNLLAGIFEIRTFFGEVSIVNGLNCEIESFTRRRRIWRRFAGCYVAIAGASIELKPV